MESGTDTAISCVISGITRQLDAVVWRKDGTDVTNLSGSNYVVSAGTYGSNSQTTTLTVKAAVNTADSTFTCAITSNEHLETNKDTFVTLNVFGKTSCCIRLVEATKFYIYNKAQAIHVLAFQPYFLSGEY